jgi:hypothetical protein
MAIDSFRLAAESDKASFCFATVAKNTFRMEPRQRVGASSRESFGVNATFKTALAMSIVIVGATVIYETFHQESWLYDSGMAMAWGATVCWVRNLI